MSHTLLNTVYQLTQDGEPFVLATVVWCERPVSAKPGAQAIIRPDGQITGWIGGSCTQPVVIREALRALREGNDPYLLRIGSPDQDTTMARQDVRVFPMTCTSGGALDIYMEPHLTPPQLLLIGNSPVIAALHQIAPALDFTVMEIEEADLSHIQIDERTYILVATHGQYDEDALEQALITHAAYIGLVASQKRAEGCRSHLRALGMAEEQIARLKAPAGLDIGAITPEEIAASILAELVQVKRRKVLTNATIGAPEAVAVESETAIDPVCNMVVEIASARHRSRYNEQEFYFCCPACKRLFERNPQEYLTHTVPS